MIKPFSPATRSAHLIPTDKTPLQSFGRTLWRKWDAWAAFPDVSPRRTVVFALLCALWLMGSGVLLFTLLMDLIKLSLLKKRSARITDPLLRLQVEGYGQELGTDRPFALYHAPNVMPMAWGYLRPVLLLPTGAENWPVERLRMVVLHELAHIHRHDWLTQLLARAEFHSIHKPIYPVQRPHMRAVAMIRS